jgi:hypothetical protein
MWIRSQNEMSLKSADNLRCYTNKNYDKPKYFISASNDGISDVVGEYKSIKRCLEILDEIEEFLNTGGGLKTVGVTICFVCSASMCANAKVYQMPEK